MFKFSWFLFVGMFYISTYFLYNDHFIDLSNKKLLNFIRKNSNSLERDGYKYLVSNHNTWLGHNFVSKQWSQWHQPCHDIWQWMFHRFLSQDLLMSVVSSTNEEGGFQKLCHQFSLLLGPKTLRHTNQDKSKKIQITLYNIKYSSCF